MDDQKKPGAKHPETSDVSQENTQSGGESGDYSRAEAAADIFDGLVIMRERAVSRGMPMLAYLIDMAALEARDEARKKDKEEK